MALYSEAFRFAVDMYALIAPRNRQGEVILSDAARSRVAEALHERHPDWNEHFNLDQVERCVFHEQRL